MVKKLSFYVAIAIFIAVELVYNYKNMKRLDNSGGITLTRL